MRSIQSALIAVAICGTVVKGDWTSPITAGWSMIVLIALTAVSIVEVLEANAE